MDAAAAPVWHGAENPAWKGNDRVMLRDLQPILAAGNPVRVVGYPTKTDRQVRAGRLAVEHGLIWLVTDRELRRLGTSGR